jgi:hypothetical protein
VTKMIGAVLRAQINEAANDAAAGKTIKPVVVMPETAAV